VGAEQGHTAEQEITLERTQIAGSDPVITGAWCDAPRPSLFLKTKDYFYNIKLIYK
jgi:hypothetical protein